MPLKSDLRKSLIKKRKNIDSKAARDLSIINNLEKLEEYKKARLVLFYAANEYEINIDFLFENSVKSGKLAAFPACRDNCGNMDFYYINTLNELKSGFFNIREPDTAVCKKVVDFSGSICIVPGISYDKRGYRLGYGKGYYDRFLQNYAYFSVGVCYNKLIVDELPADKFDIPVDLVVTENGVL